MISNRLLNMHVYLVRNNFINWCGCGICFSVLDFYLRGLYTGVYSKKGPFVYEFPDKKKEEIISYICKDLQKISSSDLSLAESYLLLLPSSLAVNRSYSDLFFSSSGDFIRGIVLFLDNLLRDRKKLHEMLGRSLATSYVIRMENHSGDYGNQDRPNLMRTLKEELI